MHSSTFSSEVPEVAQPYVKAVAVTVLILALFLIALELVTRVGFRRISRIESRTARDFADAEVLRPGAVKNVLLLGNSLLLEGLDYDRIRTEMAPDTRVTRYVIEGTQYADWHFGIRRILADGSLPDLIVLCLSPLQLIGDSTPNDYSAFYLVRLGDIPELTRATHSSLTKASSFVFAHYSLFYAGRNNIRNFVLNKAYPAYGEFLHGIRLTPGKYPPGEEIERLAEERLRVLSDECARYHTRFALLIPPAESTAGEPEVMAAGHRVDTTVLRPIPGGVLGPEMFTDGFHLNTRGRAILTGALERDLKTAGPR